MINVIICEDEDGFATELKNHLNKYAAENNIGLNILRYKNGFELTENYTGNANLIFMDIQMDIMNGLEAANDIRNNDGNVDIIFLTSLSQYAIEGYKYKAVNYLLKPVSYIRIKTEMDKWFNSFIKKDNEFIFVTNDNGKHKISLNDLKYIETYNRNLMIHTDKDNIVSYKKMKEYESELKNKSFVRCHASFLVNLKYIKKVEKLEIELTSGELIPISQPKRKAVMAKLAEYWGSQI